jgi:hypothetical protein
MPYKPPQSPALTAIHHLTAVDDNLRMVRILRSVQPTDITCVRWAVTALFYAAVHSLNAYVRHRYQVGVRSHRARDKWFAAYPELARFEVEYNDLRVNSEFARYSSVAVSWQQYDAIEQRSMPMIDHWRVEAQRP